MTDWVQLKVNDLRAELKKRGYATTGVKAELVARLTVADAQAAEKEAAQTEPAVEDQAGHEEEKAVEPHSAETNLAPRVDPQSTNLPAAMEITDGQNRVEHEVKPVEEAAKTHEVEGIAAGEGLSQMDASDIVRDNQKRKRRSASPPPSVHDTKRPKRDLETTSDSPMDDASGAEPRQEPNFTVHSADEHAADKNTELRNGDEESHPRDTSEGLSGSAQQVPPAIHPLTSALYIKNLMRPLHLEDLKARLIELATAPSAEANDLVLTDCFLDQVRTHAFASFSSVAAAVRVRCSLHDAIFPQESNRKALWVDFIPNSSMQEWIDREEQEPRGSIARFEVSYDKTEEGVKARLIETGSSASRTRAQGTPAQPPTGPRAQAGVQGAPLAPRADQQRGRGFRVPRLNDPTIRTTRAEPMIYWKPLTDDLAQRRVQNMRRYYNINARITEDDKRNDINRYFFESGDGFVDRGKEIFAGIRPPHREREHRRMMREQRQQGGASRLLDPSRRDRNRLPAPQSFRPSGGDRYMGSANRRDSWRDVDSYSRYDDRRYNGRSERSGGGSYRGYRERSSRY